MLGWTAERVSDDLRSKAFENVLDQDATFFDQPPTSNAKVIQRIAADSIGVKAVYKTYTKFDITPSRQYHFLDFLTV